MLDVKKLLYKIVEVVSKNKEYPNVVAQTVTSTSRTFATKSYLEMTVDFVRPTNIQTIGYYPIVAGWNVTGTNSSWVQVMSVYISGSNPNYTLHVKCRNNHTADVTNFVVTGHVRYIKTSMI